MGQNVVSPALAVRCFLLISFTGAMTDYVIDGVSGATPLAVLNSGGTVNILEMFLGYGGGVIGCNDAVSAALESLSGDEFGRSTINEAVVGTDGSGNVVGYTVNVTNSEAFDGTLSLSVGIAPDGTVLGIYFTELNETPGKGSLCDEPEFKDQFAGVQTDAFSVGGNIDGVSGATISSKSVVSAVNAALDFCSGYLE